MTILNTARGAWNMTYPLILSRFLRLIHELLDTLNTHFAMNFLKDFIALLETMKNRNLDQRKLDS
jgi:hypothetical protein